MDMKKGKGKRGVGRREREKKIEGGESDGGKFLNTRPSGFEKV